MKNYAKEDDQNITLQKLESCPEKQLIDYVKQPVEILHQNDLPKERRIPKDIYVENIIGHTEKGVYIRTFVSNYCKHMTFVSHIEPKSIVECSYVNSFTMIFTSCMYIINYIVIFINYHWCEETRVTIFNIIYGLPLFLSHENDIPMY